MASCSYKIARFLAFGLVLVTGASQAQPAGPAPSEAQHPAETPPYVDQQTNPDERRLEQVIMSDLRKDPQMAYSRLTVHVDDNEVIITGIVLTDTAVDHAVQIATRHAQGRKVTNRIRVNPNLNPGPGILDRIVSGSAFSTRSADSGRRWA
jgi:hypothetical protein